MGGDGSEHHGVVEISNHGEDEAPSSQQAIPMEGCQPSTPSVIWPSPEKVPISVEVCVRKKSTAKPEDVRQAVERMLGKRCLAYTDGPVLLNPGEDPFLDEHVQSITLLTDEQADSGRVLLFWQVSLQVYVYQLSEEGPVEDIEEDEELATFHEWLLPSRDFHGLWESLVFEIGVKQRLLRYASSALLFADHGVDPRLISWNRVVLLFGPPGTGKTSLCKGLAQKLAIRFRHRYRQAQLVEVNAHSLFSKWFSESGKLVCKLFAKIQKLLDAPDSLVFVLLDEVESLTAARQAALQGSEPSDSIRVVNALLTQLDALKQHPNVIILTTSNITQAIDIAFVDRADIKAYIGPPSVAARYDILRSCFCELQRAGIIASPPERNSPQMEPVSYARLLLHAANPSLREEGETEEALALGRDLLTTAQACEGLSGRALRKLPFLAHAAGIGSQPCSPEKFLAALHAGVKMELADREDMTTHEGQHLGQAASKK